MQMSDILIIASGTATLEAVYFHKPMIICYKVSWFNYFLISMLIQTRYIGLPNLLSQEQIAIELLQNEVSPENIFFEATKLLEDNSYRENIVKKLKKIKLIPEKQNPAFIVAQDIHTLIQ
jgi:lipid-A-disaccharide synthase